MTTGHETAQLAAQLPELVRGVYYENWRPSTTPRSYHSPEQFLEAVLPAGIGRLLS